MYRFQCTNSFNGTATLTISYSSDDVAGLNPADLLIYYLPDGTNRWQLVGGTVNLASNTVSATITNLGTYAAAPPLPTGDLQLVPSTNLLSADGASQMTITVTNLMLNTGNAATQQWAFTATADGVTILTQDVDTNTPGVQVYSTNGAITLKLLAPQGGNVAHVSLASVAGDAYGSTAINLLDNTAPPAPTGVSVSAGQSRIWVSWQTNSEPDTAGYRIYYRLGQVGPPWDGTAAVEGTALPGNAHRHQLAAAGLVAGNELLCGSKRSGYDRERKPVIVAHPSDHHASGTSASNGCRGPVRPRRNERPDVGLVRRRRLQRSRCGAL